jgi:hypothetical protein
VEAAAAAAPQPEPVPEGEDLLAAVARLVRDERRSSLHHGGLLADALMSGLFQREGRAE